MFSQGRLRKKRKYAVAYFRFYFFDLPYFVASFMAFAISR